VNPDPDFDAEPGRTTVAIDAIVAEQTPWLRRYLRRFWLDTHEQQDILQDVWLLLFIHRNRIADPCRIHGWLKTTAMRQAVRASTRRMRELADHDAVTAGVSPDEDPASQSSTADRDRALRRAIDRLPARDRELAWLLACRPELTYAELALRLGVAENSVGQLRRRLLHRLRRLLAAEGITDAGD
jgi:RNA polymerase sigma factor (sigma-70 family)